MSEKKRIIIIGDSISTGYTALVQERMGAEPVEIERVGGGDSAQVLDGLQEWAIGRNPDVIHLNCGLHDLRLDPETSEHQQEIAAYEANLTSIVAQLKEKTNAALIWATITPVMDERHNATKRNYCRFQRDVASYNFRALGIMGAEGIRVNDLHGRVISNEPETLLSEDGVHMTAEGYTVLADAVVAHLRQVL